jgi:hypothetical protein
MATPEEIKQDFVKKAMAGAIFILFIGLFLISISIGAILKSFAIFGLCLGISIAIIGFFAVWGAMK